MVPPPQPNYHEQAISHDFVYKVQHSYESNSFYHHESITNHNATANFNLPMSKNIQNSSSNNQFNGPNSNYNNIKASSENHLFTDPKLL